jgi:hypothetical protein
MSAFGGKADIAAKLLAARRGAADRAHIAKLPALFSRGQTW